MDIGKAIKIIRKQKGISQQDLGNSIGLSANAISQIEVGATFPQKQHIHKICDALKIPVAYLLFFCITDEDLPEETKVTFNALQQPIRNVLLNELKNPA